MAQSPLAPPPATGDPTLGRWLFLLWKRLTATGQILWSSIVPGTSADVAAVVTDETGSPGSLVFSGNPTLQGVTVDGLFYQGDTTALTGDSVTMLGGMVSTNTASGTNFLLRKSNDGANTPSMLFAKSRGTNNSPSAVTAADGCGSFIYAGYDGTNYKNIAVVSAIVDGAVSSGVVPGALIFWTTSSTGVLTERARIDSSGVSTLGGYYTVPALKVTPVASQARWIEVTGATSSGNPTIGTSAGSLALNPAGQGVSVVIQSGGASTVNYMSIGGAVAGSSPSIITGGSDANVNAYLNTQGTGAWLINTGGVRQVQINHTASADRYITLTGSNGGNPAIGTSAGGLVLTPGGAGEASHVFIASNTGAATPVRATTLGLAIGANYSAGPGEVNFYNSFYTATASFDFRQITASGTSASIVRMIPLTGGTAGLVFVQGSGTTNARIGTEAASNIVIGTGAALATTATTNHMMIPTCAGTPTGVPVGAGAGQLAVIYDTTNNKLYAYNGAWKATAALT